MSTAIAFLLLVAVAVSVMAPLLDHHTAERDPRHSHLVVGPVLDAGQALTAHVHGYERPHSHSAMVLSEAVPQPSEGSQVVAISSGEGTATYVGPGAGVLLAAEWPGLLASPFYVALAMAILNTLVGTLVSVPEAPPRLHARAV